MKTIQMMLFLFALGCVVGHVCGCSPAESPRLPAYCYNRELYIAAQARCADKATTRAQSEACGAEVDRSCGITTKVSSR